MRHPSNTAHRAFRAALLAWGLALATPLGAQIPGLERSDLQSPARARLFTRASGGEIRAAIEIEIEDGWHIYHEELGPPDVIGKPTTVIPGGEGIVWSKVAFPNPQRFEQAGIGEEPDTWFWGHEGTLVLFAAGRAAADARAPRVELDGLVCEDGLTGRCVPLRESLSSRGEGPDALFAAFPADLTPAREDEHGGGEANATLYTRVRDGRVFAAIEVDISEGWHLYHDELGVGAIGKPTRVELSGEGIRWGPARFPEPEMVEEYGGFVESHHGTIVLRAEGELEPGAAGNGVSATISGLTCADGKGGTCIPYEEVAHDRGEGPGGLFADLGPVSRGDDARSETIGLGAFLALAVFWGLFTLLMPCTYPMIPITISFFAKQATSRGGKVIPLSLTYGLGIVAIFILIGVAFGSVIIPFATHPITNIVIAALFVLFAFTLFGLINLQPPRFLMNAVGRASMTGGYVGVFLMGACLVITSFTCTAPFVGSLLSVGAVDGDLGRIVMGMGTFGLTMAVPFVLLSLVPGRISAMPNAGQWMNTLKVTLGFVELAAAFKFLSNADLVWNWNLFSREFFLLLWAVIFLGAGLYLFGVFSLLRGSPSPIGLGRTLVATAILGLASYCGYGLAGHDLDRVMTAIVPNYSGGRFFPEWWRTGARHVIVKDDYDRAIELAGEGGKLVLVNFTGFT